MGDGSLFSTGDGSALCVFGQGWMSGHTPVQVKHQGPKLPLCLKFWLLRDGPQPTAQIQHLQQIHHCPVIFGTLLFLHIAASGYIQKFSISSLPQLSGATFRPVPPHPTRPRHVLVEARGIVEGDDNYRRSMAKTHPCPRYSNPPFLLQSPPHCNPPPPERPSLGPKSIGNTRRQRR